MGRRRMLGRVGSGGGTTPNDNFGGDLIAWYSSKLSTINTTGALVDSWEDLSPNGFDVSETGGARPTLGTDTLDGADLIRFGGNTRLSYTSPITNTTWEAPFGFTALFKCTTTANNQILFNTNSFPTTGYRCYVVQSGQFAHRANNSRLFSTAASSGIYYIVSGILTGTATDDLFRIDGTEVDSGSVLTGASGLAQRGFTLGASLYGVQNPAQHLDGDIVEMTVYNSSDISAIMETEQYFNDLYGLSIL